MRKLPYTGLIFILSISIILVIPAAIFGLCTLFDFRLQSGETDPASLALSYENAPEGTVRIEPLIKLDSADASYIPTVQDSELARLNDNGYVSFSLHYAHGENGDDWIRFTDETPEELQRRYGAFRAAYVDENGNVLGVTKPARYSYGDSKLRGLKADGDHLVFNTGDIADWQMAVLLIVAAVEPLAGAALIVVFVLAIVSAVLERTEELRRAK